MRSRAWGDKWAVGEPPLRAEHHGHPIRPYLAWATCGEPVRGDDLELISTVPDWDITGPKRRAEEAVPAPELDPRQDLTSVGIPAGWLLYWHRNGQRG